jgi:hypothetical protein
MLVPHLHYHKSKKMKTTPTRLKYTFIILLAFISSVACAQTRFKAGDEFQRQIITKSNCVLQRGSQTLRIGSVSALTRTYKVSDASDKGASFTITTNRLVDTINAMDQNMVYNSAKPADPGSAIQTGLQKMVSTQVFVAVNNKGRVLSVRPPTVASDTLLSFTGVQLGRLSPGSTLPFMVDFEINPGLKKGYTWTNNTPQAETTYIIYAINNLTTTITYKTSVLGGNLNSRINGSILIDNNTGIILKRYAQSVSTGYEMVNGIVYAATRRTAITEMNTKK